MLDNCWLIHVERDDLENRLRRMHVVGIGSVHIWCNKFVKHNIRVKSLTGATYRWRSKFELFVQQKNNNRPTSLQWTSQTESATKQVNEEPTSVLTQVFDMHSQSRVYHKVGDGNPMSVGPTDQRCQSIAGFTPVQLRSPGDGHGDRVTDLRRASVNRSITRLRSSVIVSPQGF